MCTTAAYLVDVTYVDDGFKDYPLGSFATEREAVQFMMDYQGGGDCLHLYRGDDLLGYVDYWPNGELVLI